MYQCSKLWAFLRIRIVLDVSYVYFQRTVFLVIHVDCFSWWHVYHIYLSASTHGFELGLWKCMSFLGAWYYSLDPLNRKK